MIVDDLLHRRLTTIEDIAFLLERVRRRRSAGRAPRVIAFADGASESPAESRSRVVLARLGLPKPVLQSVILSARDEFVARLDFEIAEFGTVGECDGVSKYVRYLRAGESIAQAVIREKRREDAIRDTGRQMVRWIPAELSRPRILLERFERAFARAGFPDWTPGWPRVPTGLVPWDLA
jgi:hypothetical protein